MSKYNLIYKSPSKKIYLWNGKTFDEIKSKDREVLLYSGKSVKDDELDEALKSSKEAVKQLFPKDADPEIGPVKVKVA
ncbi:MAG TPA: hypothetical protein VGC01_12600 [Mucilaginibacter sp.]